MNSAPMIRSDSEYEVSDEQKEILLCKWEYWKRWIEKVLDEKITS